MSAKEIGPRLGRRLRPPGSAMSPFSHRYPPVPSANWRSISLSPIPSNPAPPWTRAHSTNSPSRSGPAVFFSRCSSARIPLSQVDFKSSPGSVAGGPRGLPVCTRYPTLVRELADTEAAAAALVENLQRQDLNAIDEAEGYERLTNQFGLTQEAVGQAIGKSRSHVSNTLRLLNLPPTVKEALRNGTISAGHARACVPANPEPGTAVQEVIGRGGCPSGRPRRLRRASRPRRHRQQHRPSATQILRHSSAG